MHKLIYISVLLLLAFSPALAQEKKYVYVDSSLLKDEESNTEADKEIKVVEAPVEDHTINSNTEAASGPDTLLYFNNLAVSPDTVQQWKNAKDFAYVNYLDSLLKDREEKEKRMKNEPVKPQTPGMLDSFLSSVFLRTLLWIAAGGFVLFILYKLFLTEGVFRKETKSLVTETPEAEKEMITSETDFDARISQSLQAGNFRQAIRYQYLRSLHRLTDKGLLEMAPDKTNYQYVRELRDRALQNDFAGLTLNYEYVWYGEFEIDNTIYQKLEPGFRSFNQKI